jgi:hypothetical protein
VLPLEPGLAALDAMKLPVEDGYCLIADYWSKKLIALVERGWANLWRNVDDVRVLPGGSWVVVPSDATTSPGSWVAAWLSRPPLPAIDLDAETGVEERPIERDPESLDEVPAGRLSPPALYDGWATVAGWTVPTTAAAS